MVPRLCVWTMTYSDDPQRQARSDLSASRRRLHVVFGILLGASIGFADGLVGLHAWFLLGRPDFFVRRNWGEGLHVICLTYGGALTGLIYAFLLDSIARRRGPKLRLGYIYSGSVAVAIPVLFCIHYLSIANRTMPFLFPELIVFVLSLAVAWLIGSGPRLRPRATDSSANNTQR